MRSTPAPSGAEIPLRSRREASACPTWESRTMARIGIRSTRMKMIDQSMTEVYPSAGGAGNKGDSVMELPNPPRSASTTPLPYRLV